MDHKKNLAMLNEVFTSYKVPSGDYSGLDQHELQVILAGLDRLVLVIDQMTESVIAELNELHVEAIVAEMQTAMAH